MCQYRPWPLMRGHGVAGEVAEVGRLGVRWTLRHSGRLVFVGYTPPLPMQAMLHELVHNAWEILGSRANTKQELQETVELVAAQGRIQPMVDRVFPFAEVEAAFEVLRQGQSLGHNVLAI